MCPDGVLPGLLYPRRETQVSGRAVGGIGAGSSLVPPRKLSTAAAALRPSAMAQTISDGPRPMSLATKTPRTELVYDPPLATLPRGSKSTPRPASNPGRSAP